MSALSDDNLHPRELPSATRRALWALLGFSLVVLLLLVQFQREREQLRQTTERLNAQPAAAPAVPPPHPPEQPLAPVAPTAADTAQIPQPPPQPLQREAWSGPMALAELELLGELLAQDWKGQPERVQKRLEPLLKSSDPQVQARAMLLKEKLESALNERELNAAEALMADAARASAGGDYSQALAQLAAELERRAAAPRDPVASGRILLEAQIRHLEAARNGELAKLRAHLEAPAEQCEAALQAVEQKGLSLDPVVRAAQEEVLVQLRVRAQQQRDLRRQAEQAVRQKWSQALNAWMAALLAGDTAKALQVCESAELPPAKSLPFDAREVLNAAQTDARLLAEVYKTLGILEFSEPQTVSLSLRRGRVDGVLRGTADGRLRVDLRNGARTDIKPELLDARSIQRLIAPLYSSRPHLEPAVWSLAAAEDPAAAEAFLKPRYAQRGEALPPHWAAWVKLKHMLDVETRLTAAFDRLEVAQATDDSAGRSEALAACAALAPELLAFSTFSSEQERALAAARAGETALQRRELVLQPGVLPTPAFSGLSCDQISQYREAQEQTDAGTQFGLKLGASGGVQRVLVRLDGLDTVLGRAAVRAAYLEFHQLPHATPDQAAKASGAVLSLTRLKRPWIPDQGSWVRYAADPRARWSTPGAAGDSDSTQVPEATLTLDKHGGVWRRFDISRYISDCLTGRWTNHGLLLRVKNSEASFDVRFYPDTALAEQPSDALRPRLVLELEEPAAKPEPAGK